MLLRHRLALLALLFLLPTPAFAWGTAGHQLIMARAIALLPAELRPFYEHAGPELKVRVVDPDTWRTAGWDEDAHHFLDFGVPEYGAFPFAALPRDYSDALARFGAASLKRNGLLPWRAAEEVANLRRAFDAVKRGSPYAYSDITLFSAVAAHYYQDATQPFHATDNYDGQKTGNTGIHARFESALLERFSDRLTLTPAPAAAFTSPRDAAFDLLLAGYQQIDGILAADTAAARDREFYDDAFYEALFTRVKPTLERQVSAAVTATASLIVTAWEQAGRPALTPDAPRAPQRIRR